MDKWSNSDADSDELSVLKKSGMDDADRGISKKYSDENMNSSKKICFNVIWFKRLNQSFLRVSCKKSILQSCPIYV